MNVSAAWPTHIDTLAWEMTDDFLVHERAQFEELVNDNIRGLYREMVHVHFCDGIRKMGCEDAWASAVEDLETPFEFAAELDTQDKIQRLLLDR